MHMVIRLCHIHIPKEIITLQTNTKADAPVLHTLTGYPCWIKCTSMVTPTFTAMATISTSTCTCTSTPTTIHTLAIPNKLSRAKMHGE